MTGVMSILEFVAKTKVIEHDLKEVEHAIIVKACQMVCAEARRVIGEGYPEWPALAPETLAHKMMNTPLLETGEMRGSIEWNAEGNEGYVGSNSDIAVYQELGTSKIPPRSFLVSAAISSEDKIHRMVGASAVAALSGHGRHARDVRELLHLLHRAGHALAELRPRSSRRRTRARAMTKVMLKDAPEGPELITRLREEAADLALFFVGEPDERVRAALHETRENLKRDLADTIGAEVAALLAERFCAAVAGRKAELERCTRRGDWGA